MSTGAVVAVNKPSDGSPCDLEHALHGNILDTARVAGSGNKLLEPLFVDAAGPLGALAHAPLAHEPEPPAMHRGAWLDPAKKLRCMAVAVGLVQQTSSGSFSDKVTLLDFFLVSASLCLWYRDPSPAQRGRC